jgi:hypothetical protein
MSKKTKRRLQMQRRYGNGAGRELAAQRFSADDMEAAVAESNYQNAEYTVTVFTPLLEALCSLKVALAYLLGAAGKRGELLAETLRAAPFGPVNEALPALYRKLSAALRRAGRYPSDELGPFIGEVVEAAESAMLEPYPWEPFAQVMGRHNQIATQLNEIADQTRGGVQADRSAANLWITRSLSERLRVHRKMGGTMPSIIELVQMVKLDLPHSDLSQTDQKQALLLIETYSANRQHWWREVKNYEARHPHRPPKPD